MFDTVTAAAASAAVIVVAFAVIIVVIEEWRLWRGQREVDRIRAKVAHDRAVAAARGRHPSGRIPAEIMRGDMEAALLREVRIAKQRHDADLAADIAAQNAKTRRTYRADELQP